MVPPLAVLALVSFDARGILRAAQDEDVAAAVLVTHGPPIDLGVVLAERHGVDTVHARFLELSGLRDALPVRPVGRATGDER